jgi:hypothetical protein
MPFPLSRTCARCGVHKPIGEFPLKNAAKGWYRSYCRPCCREYGREHYQRDPAYYKAKAHRATKAMRQRARDAMHTYLLDHPCVDCGQADPVVLEFDHRDRRMKRASISRLVSTASVDAINAEIEKCDVRCVNCHRRRTGRQLADARLRPTQ